MKKESTVIDGKTLDIIQALGLEKTPLLERKAKIHNDSKLYDNNRIQDNASIYSVATFR